MKLSQLIGPIHPLSVQGDLNVEITGLSEDSRALQPGNLFFARPGTKTSGLRHLEEALRRGAAAVVAEEPIPSLPVAFVRVSSVPAVQAAWACRFYRDPSRSLRVVGVTGTNGKTTVTYLLEAIAQGAGIPCGVVGTISYRLPGLPGSSVEERSAPNTTPNPIELQKLLAEMRSRGTDWVAMEVSSHALALGRVEGIEFDGAVFTNLTQDHLDFHKTMESYFEAKARLFAGLTPTPKAIPDHASVGKFSIINQDDPAGRRIAERSAVAPLFYGLDGSCAVRAENVVCEPSGTSLEVVTSKGRYPVRLRLLGQHNVSNALAAWAAAECLGTEPPVIQRALNAFRAVPGRMERIEAGQDFTVLVDYAHTEDALKNVLEAVAGLKPKRILTLFGCGGDRDRSKRPLMGALAVEKSDYVIVTSDNPRSEDPRRIALDIEVGIHRTGKKNYEIILDREAAIRAILGMARTQDAVVLAGKGHETYQIFADRTIHFDDREVAQAALRRS